MPKGKLLTVIAALIIVVILAATWKVVKKIKANKKTAENTPTPTPPPKPETAAPAETRFLITFTEDLLAAMEHLRITTGARDFKQLVYSALVHYDGIIKFKTNGNRIFAQHNTTGKVVELSSEQLRAASYIKIPKA